VEEEEEEEEEEWVGHELGGVGGCWRVYRGMRHSWFLIESPSPLPSSPPPPLPTHIRFTQQFPS